MTVTLGSLKLQARQRADQETSDFVSDSELNSYINSSLAELYDLLVAAYGEEYFLADPFQIAVTSGTTDYALPTDFYKLKGVDAKITGSDYVNVRPFNFNERNRTQDESNLLYGGTNLRYRIMGSKIKFTPKPSATTAVQIWYVPVSPTLVLDTDTFNDVNGFSEYVVVDAAIKMMQKEESDVSVLMNQKAQLMKRLEAMMSNRDAGSAESISDIYADNDEFRFSRS
jgi:hypothetical protein